MWKPLDQTKSGPSSYPESTLGSDKDARKVKAGTHANVVQLNDLTIAENDRYLSNMVNRYAVAKAVYPTRVLRNISTDSACILARRIRGVVETEGTCMA